jgi:uncharacterized protein YeaO (DUF488 family)
LSRLPDGETIMPIKTKRWDAPRKRSDGFRILICRYRPRALPKADETWDAWYSELGPSKELHAAFYGKSGQARITLEDYTRRYLDEMKSQSELIDEMAALVSEGKTITLLCSSACKNPKRCHRSLLRKLIEDRVQARQPAQK